jgi:ankyrin repeat protein
VSKSRGQGPRRGTAVRLACGGLVALSWIAGLSAGVGAGADSAGLIEAIKSGNTASVRALLKTRANVNTPEADGMTALHWAVRANDVETVRLLIRAGANAKASSRYGITPLSLAALNRNAAVAEMLIQAGADPNAASPEGETAVMTAARAGGAEVVKVLSAHGASVNLQEKWQGQTALMWAAAENHPAAVKALVERGADMNIHSKEWQFPEYRYQTNGMAVFQLPHGGWTALMYAARQDAKEAAAALADLKADLNAADPDGTTALHLAVINVHYELANILLEKGADPNAADRSGMTALYAAVDMRAPAGMLTRPEPKLVDRMDAADLVKALLARGANPNARLTKPIIGRHQNLVGDASLGEGTTPLMRAAKGGDLPVLRLLIAGGADATLTQKDRTTPAMIAAGGAREPDALEAVKLLAERGVDIDAFNANGQTVLHTAAARGYDSIVKYVAEKGAKLDRRDRQRRTALDVALGVGGGRGGRGAQAHPGTAALLRELMVARGLSVPATPGQAGTPPAGERAGRPQ